MSWTKKHAMGLEHPEDMRRAAQEWGEVYSALGPQHVSFGALVLPPYRVGYDRLVAVHYSMSMVMIMHLLSCDTTEWRCADGVTQRELVRVRSARYDEKIGRESYAILAMDSMRPDRMNLFQSELPVGTAVMGLQECLLMVWEYWVQSAGRPFGASTMTVCGDSRFPDGTIPVVGFGGDVLFIAKIAESQKGCLHGFRTVIV